MDNWIIRTRRHAAAFTLIELLVAISILGIIAVLGWRSLDSIVRARTALMAELGQSRGMQLTFAQLQSDCEHAAVAADIAGRPTLIADQDHLTMVRTVFADNQPTRYQAVSYRIKDGVLTRRESQATRDLLELDAAWQAINAGTDTIVPVKLQSNVTGMVVQTWFNDSPGWRVATNQASKPLAPGASAPIATGLEVALQLRGRDASMVKAFLLGAV